MRRGEVWWASLPLPSGRRPVVLVSRDSAYVARHQITVVEVSTVIRALTSEVWLGPRDGMPRACVINTDNVLTISKTRLGEKIVSLSSEKLAALDRALAFALGLDTSP